MSCNGNCQQGRRCDCRLNPARGIVNDVIIYVIFLTAAYLIWSVLK